ncbi:TnpV protein [Ruthenibacterium lactatiformans]|uniref:TnpV protein n=1 Tax=Ruthenibacterium lactatiformans TaxID=1550024 RepID=UPI000E71A968|nr:TnpV protein [Ruthenibacterium lactatiformans]RJW31052.1 TnpV protein [Subdoligranulum sp. TF05-17AC]
MTETLFEQLGGTFTQIGDYLLPDLSLPAEKDDRPIGIWGQRRLRYLKQYHKVIYYNLLTSGKLHSYLADIEEQAQQLFLRLVKELAEKEGVTEQLKSTDQMKWVQKMNNIRNRAAEMVNNEVIYGQL